MTEIYIVETRTIRIAQFSEYYLACEYVFFASSLDRAETWMQDQRPEDNERYFFCVVKSPVDVDQDFELVGHYNILGEKSTESRCLEIFKDLFHSNDHDLIHSHHGHHHIHPHHH